MLKRGKVAINKKMPINAFKARIDILGHKFILITDRPNEIMLSCWFDSIMEVLVENGLQIKG